MWSDHGEELGRSRDHFFSWQYDIRWVAQYLREHGYFAPSARRRNEPWTLTDLGRSTDALEAARLWTKR